MKTIPNSYKECKIIILETDNGLSDTRYFELETSFNNSYNPYLILIISNDKINKGDWWYNEINKEIGRSVYNNIPPEWGKTYKIIAIASSGIINNKIEECLPLIPSDFTKTLIINYNKNILIKKVWVLYEENKISASNYGNIPLDNPLIENGQIVIKESLNQTFVLVEVTINGDGNGDYYNKRAMSYDKDKLVGYCMETYKKPIGLPEVFSWDSYFIIEESDIIIL